VRMACWCKALPCRRTLRRPSQLHPVPLVSSGGWHCLPRSRPLCYRRAPAPTVLTALVGGTKSGGELRGRTLEAAGLGGRGLAEKNACLFPSAPPA